MKDILWFRMSFLRVLLYLEDVVLNQLHTLNNMLQIFDGSILRDKTRELPFEICRDFKVLVQGIRNHNPRAHNLVELVANNYLQPVVVVKKNNTVSGENHGHTRENHRLTKRGVLGEGYYVDVPVFM